MDFPLALAGLKTVNPGQFCIPTGPSAGTAVAKSTSPDTYGSYVELIASTSAALYITGATVIFSVSGTAAVVPTYFQFMLGTGAGGSETTVNVFSVPVPQPAPPNAASNYARAVCSAMQFNPPIPVASGTRIAAKVAGNGATADAPGLALQCINQSNVVAM
mgnify:CR=1 FL=1